MLNRYRNPPSGDLKASDLSRDQLLAISEVRDTGVVSMLNRGQVLAVLRDTDKNEEADVLEGLSPAEWFSMLVLASQLKGV